jgi:tRNA(adenine34) deaminase
MAEMDQPAACDEATDTAFMKLAIEQARIALSIGEVPIGAVVVHGGTPITRGYNRREIDADPSAHAEFIALLAASRYLHRWRLTGCTVYVTLEPCLMCAGLMQLSRIDRCVFGAFDPKGGALGTLYEVHRDERLNHRFDVTPGVCGQECSELLRSFFSQLRASGSGGVAP